MSLPAAINAVSPAQIVSSADWGNPVKDLVNALRTQAEAAPLGVIRRYRRTSSGGSNTGTETGVQRIDGIPIVAGRLYRIGTNGLQMDSTVNADVARARIRYTTDGSNASTSSTRLGSGIQLSSPDAARPAIAAINELYAPGTSHGLSILLTCQRTAGSGTVVIFGDSTEYLELFVEDVGVDPGSSGTSI